MATQPAESVSTALQQSLVDLVDLALLGKQAHWNIHGPHFRAVHLQLDEVVDMARQASDEVAERLVALGGTPDGRAGTVTDSSRVEGLPGGRLATDKVIREFAERIQAVADRMQGHLPELEKEDPLSHDMVVQIATGLEKQAWMFRASHEEA